MIDKDGSLRCDRCGKKLAAELEGSVRIVCPRCKHYNVFEAELELLSHTASFASHLTNKPSSGSISYKNS